MQMVGKSALDAKVLTVTVKDMKRWKFNDILVKHTHTHTQEPTQEGDNVEHEGEEIALGRVGSCTADVGKVWFHVTQCYSPSIPVGENREKLVLPSLSEGVCTCNCVQL